MTVEVNQEILYHYAVKKTGPYLEPACVTDRGDLQKIDVLQGMTVNRGNVVCPTCLMMMGSPVSWACLKKVLGDGAYSFTIIYPKAEE